MSKDSKKKSEGRNQSAPAPQVEGSKWNHRHWVVSIVSAIAALGATSLSFVTHFESKKERDIHLKQVSRYQSKLDSLEAVNRASQLTSMRQEMESNLEILEEIQEHASRMKELVTSRLQQDNVPYMKYLSDMDQRENKTVVKNMMGLRDHRIALEKIYPDLRYKKYEEVTQAEALSLMKLDTATLSAYNDLYTGVKAITRPKGGLGNRAESIIVWARWSDVRNLSDLEQVSAACIEDSKAILEVLDR